MAEGDIDNLAMEQYLALIRGNQALGMVKPEVEGNVNFEIKSQFMRELREDTFFGNKNDNAHEHVERVLDIVSLFNIQGVTHDTFMLHVFPITLTGAAKRWVDILSPRIVDSWDLFKKAFIQRYCSPSKTAKQLEEIHNFMQEGDETLYQAWERYNDLLYKCPTHDINSHQNVNIFYNGLGTMNRQFLDSHGPIPGMTHTQALTSIQTMADHSQKWHNGSSSKNIDSSSNSEGITAIKTSSRQGMSSQRGSEKFNRGASGYDLHDQPSAGERKPSLTKIINKYIDESSKRHAEQDEWLRKFYLNSETNRENYDKIIQGLETKVPQEEKQNVSYYVEPYEPPIPFPRCLEHHAEEALVHETMESLKKIRINCALLCSKISYPLRNRIQEVSFSIVPSKGMGKLEPINMVIEMADNTKCTPKGIVENLLVKIDKFIFPVDFVVLDMVEEFRMPIILGKPLLAMAHAQGEPWEIEAVMQTNMETHLSPVGKRVHWCEAILQEKENVRQYLASCDPYSDVCDGGGLPDNKEKHYWESMNDSERVDL
ncbi:hypothetical protein Tco_0172538 [Tanacetum coccineum]